MGNKSPLFVRKQSGGMFTVVDESKITGDIWFVDSGSSTGADSAGYGQNPDAPFLTWDYAIGKCTANNGDHIFLMPGHAETLTTAGDVAIDVAGITTIGLGEGADRPTFTFSSADNSASVLITAASTKIKNIIGICGDDGLTNPFHVQAADCELDITWRDPTSAIEAATCILTTADADRLKVNLKYEGQTGGNACVAPVSLVGVNEGDITVDFYGLASTAVVNMNTTLSSGIRVRGYFYNSGTTDLSKNVTASVGSCLWFASGYDGAAGCNFSGGSARAIAADDMSVIASDVVIVQSDLKATQSAVDSDHVITKSDIAAVKSDLVVIQASEDSDMTVLRADNTKTQSDVAAVKSDLVVIQASEDSDHTITKSDVAAVKSDVVIIQSDLKATQSAVDSDHVITKSDIAAVKSDLVVLQASEDSDMTILKSDIVAVQSNLLVLDGAVDSDHTITKSDIAAVKSDLVVLQASEDSDMTILKSDIASLASDLAAFRTKYNSDNP